MPKCSARNCENSDYKCRLAGKKVQFFRTPNHLKEVWTKTAGILPEVKDPRVCSDHFLDIDFVHGVRDNCLTPHAIPSQHLRPLPRLTHRIQISLSNRKRQKFLLNLDDLSLEICVDFAEANIGIKSDDLRNSTFEEYALRKISQMESLVLDNGKLNASNKNLRRLISNLKSSKRKLVTSRGDALNLAKHLRIKILDKSRQYKQKLLAFKMEIKKLQSHQEQILSKCFSAKQIHVLNGSFSKTWWTEDDISRSIVLRAKSTAAYELVRNSWGIPLPCLSTLRNWISKIEFLPGIIKPVMNLLKYQFQDSCRFNRQAVLSFDEMALDGLICYDQKHDRIVGPYSYMLVMFIRGLFANWKQPIFYGFDVCLGKETVLNVLQNCDDAGIEVISAVCDLGPNNKKFKKDFEITFESSHFVNQSNGQQVWVFADLPHLVKRLRDNSLDYVITFEDKNSYSVDDFKRLLELDSNEIRICHKVTRKHLTVKGRERMNVRMAMQLFSRSVALFFRKNFPEPRYQKLADFIELINDFVDMMNGRHKEDAKFSGSPKQMEVLDKVEREIQGMRVGKSNHLLPFQHGFLISVRSARGLFTDVQREFNAKYILMSHVNQDIDENAFGCIRSMGRYNDHPNPIDASHRLKITMLGWNFKGPKTAGVEADETENKYFLTSGLLSPLMESSGHEFVPQHDEELQENLDGLVPDIINSFNQENWTEYNESLTYKESVNLNAEEYVYGYIVSKLKDKYPDMILATDLEQRVPQSWTQISSQGNLSIPSYEWFNIFKKWEEYFVMYHERQTNSEWDLNRGENVCLRLEAVLSSKFPSIPKEAIKFYVKVRTMVRISAFNTAIKNSRYRRKNKAKEFVCSSQVVPTREPTDWDLLFEAVINPSNSFENGDDSQIEREDIMP